MLIVGILISLIIGGFVVLVLMCAIQINRENKYFNILKAIKELSKYIDVRVAQAERKEKEKVEGMKEVQKIYNHYFYEELKK